MSKYQLPELEDGWEWRVVMDNPARIELWVYRDSVPRGFRDADDKVLIETIDAGYNVPEYVAGKILNAAEKSMNWGSWTVVGQENQESLSELLGL